MPSCFGKSAPLILFIWVDGFGKYVVFRQFLVVCLGGMNLFSGRKTVGAYRIRPDVREVFAALLGDAVVWFVLFAHVEGECDTPLHFAVDCVGWLGWFGLCCSPP